MEWNSEKLHIFVPWFSKKPRHRGEQLSFELSENLQNSMYKGEKSESCSSCSSIYTACSTMESAYIYTCRCELISFLFVQVLQNLLAKDGKKAHTLCLYRIPVTKNIWQKEQIHLYCLGAHSRMQRKTSGYPSKYCFGLRLY